MFYQLIVYKYHQGQVIRDVLMSRDFEFSESSHKVTDVINMAVDQLEAEGGPQ